MLDLLITHASIVDGSGREPFRGHVGIKGDRIVGPWSDTPPEALAVLDATGRILAPGFIDVHSHADLIHPLPTEQRRGLVLGRIAQGITTEIIGNCGLGACPVYGPAGDILPLISSWMSPPESEWRWDSITNYLRVLEEASPDCNVGVLVPHGPLRVSAMGLAAGIPDPDQMALMSAWLEEGLDAGAFGLSSGLIYPPGIFSTTEELSSLARIVGRRGRIYTSHIRGSSETLLDSVAELLEIGEEADVAVHHSHAEAVGKDHWWKVEKVLDLEEEAFRRGIAVSFDMFPYPAAATTMLAIYPPWALEGGVAKLLQRLCDPRTRKRIEEDVEHKAPEWPPWLPGRWTHNLVMAVGWKSIYIGSCGRPENSEFEFLNLEELAEKSGKSPFDAISDLMIADDGMVSQIIFQISGSEEDESNLERLIGHPLGMISTDANDYGKGRPHPAAYGAFPRALSRFVRGKGVCSLSEGVRKMSGRPAEIFGIEGRGFIREGYFADLVLIDYDHLADTSTFRNPRRLAEGIEKVFVNGRPVLHSGRFVSQGAGRLLRHS